jgi:AcrR family transcriptional regulator
MARRSNVELSAATREVLLAGAREAFAEHGYADAPLEALVRSVGMTKGALYHHFGSKRGLFLAVAQSIDAEIQQRLDAALPAQLQTLEQLITACEIFLEATLDQGVRRILLLDLPAVVGHRAARELDATASIEPLTTALADLAKAGRLREVDPTATAHLLNGALYEAALWIGDSPKPRQALRRAVDSLRRLIDGLAV